jgi:hypothetical protein
LKTVILCGGQGTRIRDVSPDIPKPMIAIGRYPILWHIMKAPLGPLYSALAGGGCNVIVTGSSMEYAASDRANREDDACWPDTPYGLSKLSETLANWRRATVFRHVSRVSISPLVRSTIQRKFCRWSVKRCVPVAPSISRLATIGETSPRSQTSCEDTWRWRAT